MKTLHLQMSLVGLLFAITISVVAAYALGSDKTAASGGELKHSATSRERVFTWPMEYIVKLTNGDDAQAIRNIRVSVIEAKNEFGKASTTASLNWSYHNFSQDADHGSSVTIRIKLFSAGDAPLGTIEGSSPRAPCIYNGVFTTKNQSIPIGNNIDVIARADLEIIYSSSGANKC